MFEFDQAAGLRRMFARRRAQVTIVCGANPGIDAVQSQVSLAVTQRARRDGAQVLILDGTPGEMGRALQLPCRYELVHVIQGDKALEQVLQRGDDGLLLLPAARGLDLLALLDRHDSRRLAADFSRLGVAPDQLVVHARSLAAAGAVRAFPRGAEVIVVCAAGSAGRTLAYREIKALTLATALRSFKIVVAGTATELAAEQAFVALNNAAAQFLDVTLHYGGRAAQAASGQKRSASPIFSGRDCHAAIA